MTEYYLPIVIDQKTDRKTIDVIPEYKGDYMINNKRNELIRELIDTDGYKIDVYTDFPKETVPRVWQLMLIHLKLINHVGSFDQLANSLLELLKNENKDIGSITYSYFMKIMRLSVNRDTDKELLYIFHGD